MKKIINGKVYSTDTAQRMGVWEEFITDNLRYCSEELYRKKNGEFFLYGEGGPMTKYSVQTGGNNWSGGEKIIPLSYQAAQEWAEKHLDGEEYEEIFGEISEDDTKKIVTFSLSLTAIEKLKRSASQKGMGLSEYIESLIWGE